MYESTLIASHYAEDSYMIHIMSDNHTLKLRFVLHSALLFIINTKSVGNFFFFSLRNFLEISFDAYLRKNL
jgi:hypothetical protein